MSTEQKNTLKALAENFKHNVESYYALWQRPIRYRDIVPRFTARLPDGVNLADFKEMLSRGRYVTFTMSPRNRQYIYPVDIARDEDHVLEQLLELDRIQLAGLRASHRRTTKKETK